MDLQVSELAWPRLLEKIIRKSSDDGERFQRSSEINLKIPLLKTINGQKAFSYRVAKLWNSLASATKLASSLKTLKGQLWTGQLLLQF